MTPESARQDNTAVSNEERYRALLQSPTTFVWVADADGQFTQPQAGWEKYTGHGFDQHKGAGWMSDAHPDDRTHVAEVWSKAVQAVSSFEFGWRCWHGASQSWRQCISRGAPILNQDGSVREWVGAVLDVEDRVDPERKRAQNQHEGTAWEPASNLEVMMRLQRLSDKMLSTLIEGAPFGMYIVDAKFRIAMMNKRSQNGAFRNVRPVIGRDLAEALRILWPEHVAAEIISVFRHTLETGEDYHSPRFVNPRQDLGTTEAYEWELHQISLPDGQPAVICYYFDSTEMRKTEAALRRRTEELEAALIDRNIAEQGRKQAQEVLALSLKAGNAGTFDWDVETDVNRWSDELLEIYGMKRDEFSESSSDWRAALFPEDKERAIAALQRSLITGVFDVDFRIVRRDNGEVRWMHGAGQVFFEDGKPVRMLGINVDITAQKSIEEQLRESEARFRRLIESNIVGIVIANEERVVDANDVYLRMLGCSREDLIAGRADWVKATPPDSYQKDLHALRELREHGFCPPYEKEYVRPDGSRIPILIGVAALPGYAELTWICVVIDLSEQKRLQHALMSTNQQLLRANKDLEQFAYSASHDLQEPMRSVKIYSEMLAMTSRDKLDAEALQALDFIRSGASRMELLLRGLLSYTQASLVESPAEAIDASSALDEALKNLSQAISESKAKIQAAELPFVKIHRTRLQQLFQNLIGNAIKYRHPNVSPVIDVTAERLGGEWRFAVKDNGIGIEDQYKDRVFGLFKRLHTQNEYAGAGIGLALCQRIVQHYQGRIWVESKPGEGSTFYFTLPV